MTPSINEAQLRVLQWVADGANLDDPPSETYKTSAVALRSRGLVYLDNRRGIWNIAITAAGRELLDELQDPEATPRPTYAPLASGPVLRRIYKSNRKHETISMPKNLQNACEAVQVLLEDMSRLEVLPEHQFRVLLLLHAVAAEALRWGWTVEAPTSDDRLEEEGNSSEASTSRQALLSIDAGDAPIAVYVQRLKDRVRHKPTKRELAQLEKGLRARIPKFDHVAGNKIRLEFRHAYFEPLYLDDTATTQIEDKLRRAIDYIHDSSATAREHAESQRRRESEQQEASRKAAQQGAHLTTYSRWVSALETLRANYVRHREMAEAVSMLANFIEHDSRTNEQSERARQYVAWAQDHLSESSPLRAFQPPQGDRPRVGFDEWQRLKR
ncbi:MAG: hypothetical protein LBE60_16725 [Microbacterium sp.]|jgi:hypothetical protein|uniref:hypothetical protein n=1 Tax=Microbacterium sp. TaxID=51671 RepID=UPI002833078B|nr:hypothetical protein [Microbacterium sp.]MDR2323281.1 hypothetical protein [Microbacterium sp.]